VAQGRRGFSGGQGIADLFSTDGIHDHVNGIVRNNFVYRAVGAVESPDNGIIIADCPNAKVLHNTVILNDTFDDPGPGPMTIEYRWSTGVVIAGNLCDGGIWERDELVGSVSGNYLEASPAMFVDAPGADLHLVASASAAIDQLGVNADVPTDWDGEARPVGAGVDIGADEFRSPPSAPSGLTAVAVSMTGIDLAWNDNASDETSFVLERRTGDGAWAVVANPAADATTYADTGLAPGTTYTYRVKARGGSGDSAYSNEATATTDADQVPVVSLAVPSAGGIVAATVSVTVSAYDEDVGASSGDGILQVTIALVRGALTLAQTTLASAPFEWSIDTASFTDGSYAFVAVATSTVEAGGASTTETVVVEFDNGSSADADTDGDGLPDWWEVRYGYDPGAVDSDADGQDDPDEDPDGDGKINLEEYTLGLDPTVYDAPPAISDGAGDVSCAASGSARGGVAFPVAAAMLACFLAVRLRGTVVRRG
jgi:hypothetical protein